MNIEQKREGDLLILRVMEDYITLKNEEDFKNILHKYIASGNYFIVLNLFKVNFVDSSFLGTIVSCLKLIGNKGELVIGGLNESIISIFQLTRMDKIFRIFYSEKEAVNALNSYAKIEIIKKDSVLIVKILTDRLDNTLFREFKRKMYEHINSGSKLIVLNLVNVNFIDSNGLGAIISCFKLIGDKGNLVISNANEKLISLFELTKMDRIFSIFESDEAAIINLLSEEY